MSKSCSYLEFNATDSDQQHQGLLLYPWLGKFSTSQHKEEESYLLIDKISHKMQC